MDPSSGIPDFQKCSLANMGCALPQTPLELRDCVGGSGVYFGKNNYFNRHLGLQKINYPFRDFFSLENKTPGSKLGNRVVVEKKIFVKKIFEKFLKFFCKHHKDELMWRILHRQVDFGKLKLEKSVSKRFQDIKFLLKYFYHSGMGFMWA